MKNKMLKRMLCGLLACVLVLGYVPVPAHAVESEGLCPHHTQHTPECGYSAGVAGSPCTHVCDAGCYQTVTQCTHVHGDCGYAEGAAESVCTHVCSVESGCVVVIPNCRHVHDDSCGYAAEIPESPCTYQCAECQQAASDQAAADAVAALIAELPTVEALRAMTAEEQQAVYNRLQAVLNAYNALTGAQKALIPNAEAVLLPLLEYFDSLDSTGNQGTGNDEDVEAIQALIDGLPTPEEVQAMPMEEQLEVYNQVQSVYAVYDALTDDQKAQISNAEETFAPLFEYFNSLVAAVWDGTGTASSPYLIHNEDDLRALAQSTYDGNAQANTYFALTGNITLSGTWTPIGTEATKFCGIFNGQGYTISGISGTGSYLGLFAYLGGGAQVENVNVASVNLSGGPYLAGIAAVADHTSGQIVIRNCHALSGTITGIDSDDAWIRDLAGIVGYAHGGIGITIERCTNSVYINAGNNVTWAGGIAGELTRATVTSCINYANVSGNAYSEENGSSYLGGISGEASGSTFTGCANYGQISTFFAAGIAGGSGNRYSNCLNGGTLTHSSDGYGDPIGRISNNRFDNCYFSKDGYEGGMLWNDPSKTGTKVGSLSDGSVAYDMGNYFGQVIGTDPYPVLLTSANQVHKVTITGEIAETLYVTHNRQMNLTLEDANLKLFLNDSEFDISTPITGDISLTARVERTIVAGGTCGAQGDNLTWVLTDDGVLTISGTGEMTNYTSQTSTPWYSYLSDIQDIIIADGVTSIGDYAFGVVTYPNVSSVTVPQSVTKLGLCAFGGNNIQICYPGTMEQWLSLDFYFMANTWSAPGAICSDGTILTLGFCGQYGVSGSPRYVLTSDGCMRIYGTGDMQFYKYLTNSSHWKSYNSSITSVVVEDGVTSIADYSFDGCQNLTQVTLPDNLRSLGYYAFRSCTALKAIDIPSSVTYLGSGVFQASGLESIEIPEGVKLIKDYSFLNCSALSSVTIPSSVTDIGGQAFYGCGALTDVYYGSDEQAWNQITIAANNDSLSSATIHYTGPCAEGHTEEIIPGKAATCTEDGLTDGKKCSVCGEILVAQEVISASGHQFNSSGVCTVCGVITGACGDHLTWELTTDGILTISGTGAMYDYASASNAPWYSYRSRITSLVVSDGATSIGENAFRGSSVQSVSFGNASLTLGTYSFAYCDSLTSIDFGSGTIQPGDHVFEGCTALTSVHVPQNVVMNGSYSGIGSGNGMFTGCSSLQTATVDCSYVGPFFFETCASMTQAIFTNPNIKFYFVENGDSHPFRAGSKAMNVNVVGCLCSQANVLVQKGQRSDITLTFSQIAGDTTQHTEQVLPGTATCTQDGLSEGKICSACGLVLVAQQPVSASHRFVNGVCSLCGAMGGECGAQGDNLTWVLTDDGVLTISGSGKMADYSQSSAAPWFSERTRITTVVLTDGVTFVGNYAFYYCHNLTSVTIPEGITTIGNGAFSFCTDLTSVTIPEGVTSIGDGVFTCCSRLTSVTIPKGVTSIGERAFSLCTDLTSVTIPEGVTSIGVSTFYNCSSLSSVTLPKGVTSIAEQAFIGCSNLTVVTIPEEVTSIGADAFYGCTSLTTVQFLGNGFTGTDDIFHYAVTAYYPHGNTTWTQAVRDSFGSYVTWVEACTAETTHIEVIDPGKAATCTETGLTEGKHCSACNTVLVAQQEIPAKGHTEVIDAAKAPTCTETGLTEGKHCSVCNKVLVAQTVVPAKGHTEVIDAAVAPTCTETGLTEGKHCSVCNEVLVAQTVVPAKSHTEVIDAAVAPTCTETGLTEGKHCSVCNTVLVAQENVPAKGHTEVIDAAVAPTCTETGLTEGKHCSVCNEVLVAQEVVPAKGHTEVIDPAVEPTCTETGLTEGKHCSVCNEVLVAQTVVPATGHTEVIDTAVAPTCTETGLTEGKHCSVCNEVLVAQTVVPAKGHTEVIDAAVAPTCTETGLTEGKHCSVCNEVLVAQTVVPAKGHTEVIDAAVVPTCTETGLTEGKHCSVCNEVLVAQTVVPATGHTEVIDAAVAPTCTETGLTEGKHCSVCNEVLVAQTVVPATGHTEVIDAAVAPTCTETGLTEGKHCSVCNEVLVAQTVVPAKGHTEVIDAAVAPTCTETGLTEGKHCSVCNTVLVAQENVPAKGHTEVVDEAVEATCTETGLTEGKHCSVCNEVLVAQTVVPAKGHTEVIDAAVAPTCTETGLTEGKHCSVCNEVLVAQETVPAKGHTEETIPGKAATCTETGLTDGVKCSVCDKILVAQTVVSRKAHTEEIDPAVEATCTEPGLTEGKHCSVCGVTLVGQNSVPAKGHTVVIDEAVEATCTETGLTEGKHCSVCDKILAEQTEVPAKGHTEVVDEAVEATCTETGLTEGKHCSVCDEVLAAQEEVPALGHDWGEWTVSVPAAPEAEGEEIRTCSRCEEEETRPLAYTGHRLELTGTGLENESVVWIDGAPCYVQKDASGKPYLILPEHCTPILVTYSFNTGSGDRHAQYPTGMQVYRIVTTESGMTVEHIPELDNLLQYSGSSIRITGKKGIRMITSINQATRNALTGSGLAGFTLLEYGTALCRSSVLEGGAPLVLGTAGVKSNYAYLKDVADPVFKYTGGLIQYTNVLVGFSDEDCKEDIAMRPYIKLQDESGEVVTIYGGTVYRSIGYIAYQNRNAFKTGSEAYNYVWNIIHYVYGDQYDADYKG